MSISLLAKGKSGLCKKCAKCCKEFVISNWDNGALERFKLLGWNKIYVDSYGNVHIKKVCSQLVSRNGVYSCKIHNQLNRPLLCRLYPDNVPVCDWVREKDNCPIIKEAYEASVANGEEKQP
jgi:Fe-S-cluster containining protein